jgi:hypothetical protein
MKIKVIIKKMYPKLMLNKLKVMEGSTFIYTHWEPNLAMGDGVVCDTKCKNDTMIIIIIILLLSYIIFT